MKSISLAFMCSVSAITINMVGEVLHALARCECGQSVMLCCGGVDFRGFEIFTRKFQFNGCGMNYVK